MLRYKTETRPGLVALYDIQPGNGVGPFLQPGASHTGPWKGDYTELWHVCCEAVLPAVVSPEIVSSTEEVDSKLSDVVRQVSNVEWNHFRMTDLTRPPSTHTHTHTHTHKSLTFRFNGHFPGEHGLAGCTLNPSSPLIPKLCILLGKA